MSETNPNSLKSGITKSGATNLKSGPTNLRGGPTMMRSKLGGGPTKMQGSKGVAGTSNRSKQSTKSQRENEYVKVGDQWVTPKRLYTDTFKNYASEFIKVETEEVEKEKKAKANFQIQSSVLQSSMRSAQHSEEQSSGSDVKHSSSNMKESSIMDSQKSGDTESDDHDRKKQEKNQQNRPLTEQEQKELITINLGETETIFLLHIPSSLVAGQSQQTQDILQQNVDYERYMKDKIGSDNYTSRAAQTFNLPPQVKDQQCNNMDKKDIGVFATEWDIHDQMEKDQPHELKILQDEIKKSIEKEMYQRLKNPFCLLPIDQKAIELHTQTEVPGYIEELKEKVEKQPKREGGVGTTTTVNPQQKTNLHGSTTLHPPGDSSLKDSSGNINDLSGSRLKQSGTIGGTKGQVSNDQLIREQEQKRQDILEEENKMYKEIMEEAKKQPPDQEQRIFSSDTLLTNLKFVERILNQTLYHKEYILYRNYPEYKPTKNQFEQEGGKRGAMAKRNLMNKGVEDEKEDTFDRDKSCIRELFRFSSPLTKGRTVSSADWNPVNKDLLAVTYGELDLSHNADGYIQFFTLKNPNYPERTIRYPSRITSCQFSSHNPFLLATGTYDGIVAIYDIRKQDGKPVAENREMAGSQDSAGKHSDAIWEVKWLGKGGGSDKGDSLVSISSDGRIVEWSMKQGLEYTDLMNLKRQSQSSGKENSSEGMNFRHSAGFSIDFLKGESSIYLAATEDGSVHRCSQSYSEQYLDSYNGHTGPVYRVRCNPFFSDVFLTCSADWSCKLWNWKEEHYRNNFQSLDLSDEVLDIEWSPHCSTLFASVCKDGRLELWDLTKKNMLDPLQVIKAKEGETLPPKTMVRFSEANPIIITGDTAGDVNVYRLYGYQDLNPKIQQQKIIKLLYPTGYSKGQQKSESI